LVSVVGSWLRANEPKPEAAPKVSQYQGSVGDRLTFEATVKVAIVRETRWGVSTFVVMEDADGNLYKWFASGSPVSQGDVVKVTATVKGHEEYKGQQQTVITRAKLA